MTHTSPLKKTLCIDFDGVIHSYTSGFQGIHQIADPPVPGALDALMRYLDHGFHVCIYSSRNKEITGVVAMARWFNEQGFPAEYFKALEFPTQKPSAWLTLDDRCLRFNGQFPGIDEIENFLPWFQEMKPEADKLRHWKLTAAIEALTRAKNNLSVFAAFSNDEATLGTIAEIDRVLSMPETPE